ncbi:LysR family transcriptional regulator, partial [Streptomyces sp. NPDC002690]
IALAHRTDVAPPRAARELQRMLLEADPGSLPGAPAGQA